jgi:hypothetical protein
MPFYQHRCIPRPFSNADLVEAVFTRGLAEEVAAKGCWRPIETAPKNKRIRVWSWGAERHAEWDPDKHALKPRPFWLMSDLSISSSRSHQPDWWMPCADQP